MRRTVPATFPFSIVLAAGDAVFCLYGARYDVVLHFFAEFDEEGGVARDPHEQAAVVFRVHLGLYKFFLVYDVELYVVDSEGAEAFEERHDLVDAVFAVYHLRVEFHVEECALDEAVVRDVGDGFEYSGRTVGVCAAVGADAVGQRFSRAAARWQGSHFDAEGGVAGDGQDAGGHDSEFAAVAFDLVGDVGEEFRRKAVYAGIVVAVFGGLFAGFVYFRRVLEVTGEGVEELFHGDAFCVIYEVFDGGDAVYEVGDADADYAVAGVVFGASPGVVFGVFDAFFKAEGEGWHRAF